MIRLLIFGGLIYLLYQTVKKYLSAASNQHRVNDNNAMPVDDVMIKDPVCGVYFPKRNGYHSFINGQDVYFCSEDCKKKYIDSHPH